MSKHIWYSSATDITGQALAEALEGVSGSRSKPARLTAGDIVIGWGAKTDADVSFGNGVHVLNHPNKIKANRDKLEALTKMAGNRNLAASIAKFCAANIVIRELDRRSATIKLPVVGRTKYHQGGTGFWLCLTKQHIQKAIDDGAAYFQNYIDIKDEYRLHVAFGNVIYAVKKLENATEAGWTNQRKEKIADYNQKNNWNLDDNTIDRVLALLYKEASLPDRIVRSNKRGWKFSSVRLENVTTPMKNAAKKAVEVMELDFGAVDCAIGNDDNPYIIEINSGPGLQGTARDKYIEAFRAKISELEAPPAEAPARQRRVASESSMRAGRGRSGIVSDVGAGSQGMVRVMHNVKSDEEAQAVIQALMAAQDRE